MTARTRTILIFSVIILFTLSTFWGIWDTYFQQDEWNGFGKVLYAQKYGYWSLVRLYGSHFTPFSSLFFALLFNIFGYNASGYAWYSLILHGINGTLVYILASKISKRTPVALFAAFWFISAYVSRQAVLWFAASPSFLPAAFFSLISLIIFENYLVTRKIVFLYISIVFCFFALGFRENEVFLFGYITARTFFVKRQLFKKTAIISISSGIVYCLLRFLPVVQNKTGSSYGNIGGILAQAIEFIFISLPQMLITRGMSINFFRWIMDLPFTLFQHIGTSINVPVFIETVLIRWFLGCFWIIITIFMYFFITRIVKEQSVKLAVCSLIVFTLLSVLPFSLLPRNLFMESRHFYISTVGFSILLGFIFHTLLMRVRRYTKYFILILFIGIIGINILHIHKAIGQEIIVSNIRKSVIQQFVVLYPVIPKQALFLSEGDMLPFQSGDGYTLMVLLQDKQPYHSFLKEDFLWNIASQGYKEENSIGFGYFSTYNTMLEAYCSRHLQAANVFSFFWNESEHTLINTTELTRQKLLCHK